MRAVLLIGLLVLGIAGCQSDDEGALDAGNDGDPNGPGGDGDGDGDGDGGTDTCNVTAPTACPSDEPTFADVEPIFQERCVPCHQGMSQNELCPECWALTDYAHVASWAQEIKTAMLSCAMPPKDSGMTMTDDERMKLLEWVRCGSPQ